MLNKKLKPLICLIFCTILILTACSPVEENAEEISKLYDQVKEDAGEEDLVLILGNPDFDDYEGLEDARESYDFQELGSLATNRFYIVPLKDKVDISVEELLPFGEEIAMQSDFNKLGEIDARLGEHYVLDVGLLNPNQSIRIVAQHEGKYAAHKFIRSDIEDKSVLLLSPENSASSIGSWKNVDVFSGNAALAKERAYYDRKLENIDSLAEDPENYWLTLIRILMDSDQNGESESFISKKNFDFLSSVLFSTSQEAELINGVEKDQDGNFHYRIDEFEDNFFYDYEGNRYYYFEWDHVLMGSKDKLAYVVTAAGPYDGEAMPPYYRVTWEEVRPYNPYDNLDYRLLSIDKMRELEFDWGMEEFYIGEYFNPILHLGLEFQNWTAPEELDVETLLEAYEFFNFNYNLDFEEVESRDGELVLVPREEVESYMYDNLRLPANHLRASSRYRAKEKVYEMEILIGLGDSYLPVELNGIWEYENTRLMWLEYTDMDYSRWYLFERDEVSGNYIYLGGWGLYGY